MTTDNTGDTDQSETRGLPASRRTTLQLLSAATLGKATGTVAAFDAFVAEELDTENTDEWFLRLKDPLGYTVDSASAGTLKQAAFAAQEPVVDAVSRMDGVRARGQFWIPNAVLVAAPDRSIEELRAIEGVTTVHPNFEVSLPEPADEQRITLAPDGETTYGLDQLDLSDAREEYGVDGDGVTVSIVDTGADPGHQDIEVAEFLELDEDGEIVWDTLEDEEAAEEVANDPEGHGTRVAGTAVGRNEAEEFGIGVAPAADHVSVKVFPSEQRSTTFANIAETAMERRGGGRRSEPESRRRRILSGVRRTGPTTDRARNPRCRLLGQRRTGDRRLSGERLRLTTGGSGIDTSDVVGDPR